MNDLAPIIIIPAGFYAIYSIFELFVRRKERMAIIEKLAEGINPNLLTNQLALPKRTFNIENKSAWTIRIGCLLLGIGLGVAIVAAIDFSTEQISIQDYVALDNNARYSIKNAPIRQAINVLYPAAAAVFGGIGLITAYFVERMFKTKDEK